MNSYLAEFLTMGLDKHLENILDFFFDFGVEFFSNLLFLFFGFVILSIVFIFPILISKIVSRIEEKYPKYAIIIDIGLIIVVAVVSIFILIFFSGLSLGLSSEGGFYGTVSRGLRFYRENIAVFCGIIYSILVNNCLLKKYFVKLKIEKYQKPIFIALFVVFLFMFFYFYYLCQI